MNRVVAVLRLTMKRLKSKSEVEKGGQRPSAGSNGGAYVWPNALNLFEEATGPVRCMSG